MAAPNKGATQRERERKRGVRASETVLKAGPAVRELTSGACSVLHVVTYGLPRVA